MKISNSPVYQLSEFLKYIASIPEQGDQRIPPLSELSQVLGISVATLREQLEVARALGIVEVKPRLGIRKLPYDFKPALITSLTYSVQSQSIPFTQFSDLRKHLEAAYFVEAAQLLIKEDIQTLLILVKKAKQKIKSIPGQIPVTEHREFHNLIYRQLKNQFLNGILESYWDLYKIAGFEIYPDLAYIERVWNYHGKIVEKIQIGNFSQGLQLLMEHMELINQREKYIPRLSFE